MDKKQITYTLACVGITPTKQDLDRLFYNTENIETVAKLTNPTAEFNIFPLNIIRTDAKEKIMKVTKKPLSKTDIAKKIKLSYKPAYDHIQQLINTGLLKEETQKDSSGMKKMVCRTDKNPDDLIIQFVAENKSILKKYV